MSAARWTPPPRPGWVERLIAHADAAGGAAHLVPLAPGELCSAARAGTGLSDFGPDSWKHHFDVLLRSLADESDLHVVGRLMARAELLRSLRARLGLAALWGAAPEILDRPVEKPVFVVGLARSGTSILHELLSVDPAARSPRTWELHHPAEAARGGRDAERARSAGDAVHAFWSDVVPDYGAMHENRGDLPNECIFATAHEFLSEHWLGNHVVPGYALHAARADHADAYRYHRRVLQTLQGEARDTRWVLKAPSHLAHLRTLFAVYPDARVVQIHRDPLKSVASTLSLMGALKWMRCNRTDVDALAPILPRSFAAQLDSAIDDRADGRLPDAQFVDVRYADLMNDPGGAVRDVFERLGWPADRAVRARVNDYAAAKPKGAGGEHRYAPADFGLEPEELRALFARYAERFAIPVEV